MSAAPEKAPGTSPDVRITVVRNLLDDYPRAMAQGNPRDAREAAYQMLQLVMALYNAAYTAEMAQARREGKAP